MQKFHKLLKLSILLLALVVLPACGFLKRNTIGLFSSEAPSREIEPPTITQEEPKRGSGSITRLRPETTTLEEGVEVIWQIPLDPVDGFILHYGYNRDKLDSEIRLASNKIEKYEDPKFGFVYRYVLKDIPRERRLFVAISAFRGNTTSNQSEVFEAAPEKPPVTEPARSK